MGGTTTRPWNGFIGTNLGDPPERSVAWGRGRRMDAWRPPPDDGGHWIPQPPFPKSESGDFLPITGDPVGEAIKIVQRHRLGLRLDAIAEEHGIKVRAMRNRMAVLRGELERMLLVAEDPDPGIAQILAEFQRISRPGRPKKTGSEIVVERTHIPQPENRQSDGY